MQYVEDTNENSKQDWQLTTTTLREKSEDCSVTLTIRGLSDDTARQIGIALLRFILTDLTQVGLHPGGSLSEERNDHDRMDC